MKTCIVPLMFICTFSITCVSPAQVTHYVRTNGTCNANCTVSFANAYADLQAAIQAASAGDTILVAQGTYKPTAGINRSESFSIPGGVSVYGGFEGTASEIYTTQSQPETYETILSGAIGSPVDTDNSYHVVKVGLIGQDVTLYGLSIEDGNANHLLNNYDKIGGGLRYDNNAGNGKLWIMRCTIRSNNANKAGGGLHASRGDLYVNGCTFSNNTQSEALLSAGCGGGAIFLWSNAANMDAEIGHCRFLDNEMGHHAAFAVHGAYGVKVHNTLFSGNQNSGLTAGSGSAIHGTDADNLLVVNSTVINNHTDALLGAHAIDCSVSTDNFDIHNTIVWDNTPASQHPVTTRVDDVEYCDITNFSTWTGPLGSTTGTVGVDPLILNGEGHISAFSPCVDAGLDSYISSLATFDFRGESRIVDQDCSGNDNTDMGAFEVQEAENQRIYVSPGGDNSNGFGWNTAYNSLQDGIALAHDCYSQFCNPAPEIWVREATYVPGSTPADAFMVQNDMTIYGGFAGTEEYLEQLPVYTLNPTIISGDLGGGNHSHHLFKVNGANLIMDGFYLSGANAYNSSGGAFSLYDNAYLTLRNAVVHDNEADHEGGGIHCEASQVTCVAVEFEGNRAANGGAIGLYDSSSLTLEGCTLETNMADQFGGAVYASFNSSQITASDLLFSGNSATLGGAVYQEGGISNMDDCMFYGNEASEGGALYLLSGAEADIEESNFEFNGATGAGGAMFLEEAGLLVSNCTLSTNSGEKGGAVFAIESDLLVELSLMQGNAADTGGAIYLGDQCTMTLRNASGYQNSATGNGGFICNDGMSDVFIGNLYVIGNTAGGDGGVFYAGQDSSDFFIANIVGLCNTADGVGHVYYSDAAWSQMRIYFGSFYANTHPSGWASTHSVVVKTNGQIGGLVVSSIFFQNQARTFCGTLFVSHTNTDGVWNCSGTYVGPIFPGANMNIDPIFIDPPGTDDEQCTLDDHLRLNGNGTMGANSLSIDAGIPWSYLPGDFADIDADGDTAEVLPADIDGNPRVDIAVYDSIPDMGAYENDGSYKQGRVATDKEEDGFVAYPNPTNSRVTIVLHDPIQNVKLYNMKAQIEQITAKVEGAIAILDLTPLASGVYFLEIEDDSGKRHHQKIEKL